MVLSSLFYRKRGWFSNVTPERSSFKFVGEVYDSYNVGGPTPHMVLKPRYVKELEFRS